MREETWGRVRGAAVYFGVLALAVVVLVLRRPDIVSHPVFWAEDGKVWFEQAYQHGRLRVLFWPQNGYLQTFSRLVFGALVPLPLELVPAAANAVALAIRGMVIAFLFTRRFDGVDLRVKMIMLLYFVLMPGIAELTANVTNTHWYLALYMAMVVAAEPPRTAWWRLHDVAVILLAGLSGPFAIVLAVAIGVVRVLPQRSAGTLWQPAPLHLVVLCAAAAVQLTIALASLGQRTNAPLGELSTGAAVIMKQVVFGLFRVQGADALAALPTWPWLSLATVTGIVAFALWRVGARVRIVAIFGAAVLAASLAAPMMSHDRPQWPLLLVTGDRYFLIPRLALFTLLVAAVGSLLPAAFRWATTGAAAALVAALCAPHFAIAPIPASDFRSAAAAFDRAPSGTVAEIPIAPRGWSMVLKKH